MTNLAPTSTDNPFRRRVATSNAMIATAKAGSTASRAMGVIPDAAISKERFFGLEKSLTAIHQ